MNIKQIIKEEIDDMEWIQSVSANPVVSGTLVFIGNTTNTTNTKNNLKRLKSNSYNIIRLTVDDDAQTVTYDTVVSNNWNHHPSYIHDSITVEWTNNLFSKGYWRLVSENVPQEMLVPTSNKKENNTNIPADDWEPYIRDVSFLFNYGVGVEFNELNESDIKWIEDEMALSTEVWDRNKYYVLDVSELPNRPPRFSHNPKLFKSDILSYAKEMGYDTMSIQLGKEVCYIYFNPRSDYDQSQFEYLEWDLCDITDPTSNGKYEMINIDTFLFLMENKLIK